MTRTNKQRPSRKGRPYLRKISYCGLYTIRDRISTKKLPEFGVDIKDKLVRRDKTVVGTAAAADGFGVDDFGEAGAE